MVISFFWFIRKLVTEREEYYLILRVFLGVNLRDFNRLDMLAGLLIDKLRIDFREEYGYVWNTICLNL